MGSLSQKFLRRNTGGRNIDGEIGLLRGEYVLLRMVADGDPVRGLGERPNIRIQAIDITPVQKPQLPKVTEITIEYRSGRSGRQSVTAEVEQTRGSSAKSLSAREALQIVAQAVDVLKGYRLR